MMTEWRSELDSRRARVRRVLAEAGCDVGLVFGCDGHAEHFRYLTNFAPVLGDSWLIMDAGERCVLTFQWQIVEARGHSGIEQWEAGFDSVSLVLEILQTVKPRRLGVAGLERMPAPFYTALRDRFPAMDIVNVSERVAELRRRKSELEVQLMRDAGKVTDVMLDAARQGAQVGVSESDLAAELSVLPLRYGGKCSFETTVVSGVDDPVPIRRPTARRLAVQDSIMIDLGAEIEGYQADATRTFVLGRPQPAQIHAWDVVRRAYDAAINLARPGVPCAEMERVSAEIIREAGFIPAHRIGHGIGLATSFEWPSLDTEQSPLEPGMTICIEPGVYAPGIGNMKLEDDVLITETGCELLTHSDQTLEVPL